MFLFQTAMGQTMSDSIVFHGKIVNDGILYNIGFILRIKNKLRKICYINKYLEVSPKSLFDYKETKFSMRRYY